MTIQQMHDFFDLICDKVGSDYFIGTEKDSLINKAVFSIVNDYFFNFKKKRSQDSPPQYSFEINSVESEALQPLITEPVVVSLDNTGSFTMDHLSALTGFKTMHILNVSVLAEGCTHEEEEYVYCRFVRHNDFYKHVQNVFKKPTEKYPTYRYFSGKVRINPRSFNEAIVTTLREPELVSLSGSVDCELPNFMHNEVMFRAITYSGINMRDKNLFELAEQIKNENG